MQFHFLSGLPRSGSTLLASILRQNPAFHASIMSPVGHLVTNALQATGAQNEAECFISDEQRRDVLRGIFAGYYLKQGVPGGTPVIFDNNRRWTANAGVLGELYPDCKIICCVRSPAAIVDSFERLFQKTPLSLSAAYGAQSNLTVYERVAELMKPTGVVGYALHAFRGAFFGPHHERLVCVSYSDLCRWPAQIMLELHEALGVPQFPYDFRKIEQIPGAAEFDVKIGTPGLHDLKSEVVLEPRQSVLPPDIFSSLPEPFWDTKNDKNL